MECLCSGFLINHLCLLLFLSDVSAIWPDQNLENGSSGGTCCVLLAGGTTEPSSVPRGASGWSSKDIQRGILSCGEWVSFGSEGSSDTSSVEVLSEGVVATVCFDSSGGGVVTVSSLTFTKFCTLFQNYSLDLEGYLK